MGDDQPAQIDCRVTSCMYYGGAGVCTNVSPAITLNENGSFKCWSKVTSKSPLAEKEERCDHTVYCKHCIGLIRQISLLPSTTDSLADKFAKSPVAHKLGWTDCSTLMEIAKSHYADIIEQARKESYEEGRDSVIMNHIERGKHQAIAELKAKFEASLKEWQQNKYASPRAYIADHLRDDIFGQE